ncbi:MAG: hypothetical protein H0W08_15060 [Acidobacteria bacterium]|nr:hypothetical protein [Acidobacteriota bacterium]
MPETANVSQIRGRLVISILALTIGLGANGCGASALKSTLPGPPTADQLAQLWIQPDRNRDLFHGVGGSRLAPDPAGKYAVIEIKRGGFSRGYTVIGPDDREWSAKFPPEAGTEIVASRVLWGIGYHQPPIYLLGDWAASKATSPNPQLPARFREKKPDLHGLDAGAPWSYYQNPFVGTPQMNGLLVLQAMLGNSDLKDAQNVVYKLDRTFENAQRWYVARDLGQTFGRTGVIDAPRGDIEVFEETPFIRGVAEGRVRLEYRGRHKALFGNIRPADVRWVCERLDKLTDQQWRDAFRAGGIDSKASDRFIRRMKQKIAEGLALKDQ